MPHADARFTMGETTAQQLHLPCPSCCVQGAEPPEDLHAHTCVHTHIHTHREPGAATSRLVLALALFRVLLLT